MSDTPVSVSKYFCTSKQVLLYLTKSDTPAVKSKGKAKNHLEIAPTAFNLRGTGFR